MIAIANRLQKLERQADELTPNADGGPVDRLFRLIENTHGNEPDALAASHRVFIFGHYLRRHMADELPDDDPERGRVLADLEHDERELESWRWQSPCGQTMAEVELVQMGILDRELDIGDRARTDEWRGMEEYLRGVGWLEKFARQRPAVERCMTEINGAVGDE